MAIALEMRLDAAASEAALNRLAGKLEDRSGLNARLAGYLEATTQNRFTAQAGPDGQRWTPSIRARLVGGLTLVAHAASGLLGSITSSYDAEKVETGTNKIYGAMMHFGGIVKAKGGGTLKMRIPGVGWRSPRQVTIPGRPWLGIGEGDRQGINEVIFDYLSEAAAR